MYIINRIPLSINNNISPYERLYGQKPNNSQLKSFSCLCFVFTKKQGRPKLHPRTHATIFIGYVFGQKAYKTYNPSTNQIIISREVSFQEHHFPYHFHTPPTSTFFKCCLPSTTHLPIYDESDFFLNYSVPCFVSSQTNNPPSTLTT